jgi:hypothetical protein
LPPDAKVTSYAHLTWLISGNVICTNVECHALGETRQLVPMTRVLITILAVISINSFGQQWSDYKVDENLTVRIPDNFEVMDTLGQHIISARIDNALIMVQRIPNKGEQATNIQDKSELIENYKGFQNGIIQSQNGRLKDQEIIEKDELQLIQFSYYATMGEERQVRHCLGLFINESWYAVHFWEVEARTVELTKDREKLFTSVKFPAGSSLKNQMSNSIERSPSYNWGFLIGKTLGYILILVAVVSLVSWISKKVKRKSTSAQQKQ